MAKKKNNIILVIPAFLLIGIAIGIQTKELFKQALIGLIVGIPNLKKTLKEKMCLI